MVTIVCGLLNFVRGIDVLKSRKDSNDDQSPARPAVSNYVEFMKKVRELLQILL